MNQVHRFIAGVVVSGSVLLVAAAVGPACAGSDEVDNSTSGTTSSARGGGGGAGGETSSAATNPTKSTSSSGANGGGGNGGTAGAANGGGGAGANGGAGGMAGDGGTAGSTSSSSTAGGGGSGGCQAQPEICNGLDDNCNNQVDEGDPGGGADCMAVALGECKNGKMHCVNGAPKCVAGQVQPEICDGLDNNCDGNIDEGNPGGGFQCMTGFQGICASGVTQCTGMNGVTCMPSVTPGSLPEACNGLDDDCDGVTDEGIAQVGQPCTAPGFLGICQFGTYVCPTQAPFQLTCNHPAPGTVQEVCNGQDDDCNGTIDDPGLVNGQPCSTGLPGICSMGTTQCVGGSSQCIGPAAQTEICDSLDNNCNGQTDEMNPTPACASQNPGAQFVSTWSCTGGNCGIVTCQFGHADIDGAMGNGCECSTDQWANTCNNATSQSVPTGGTVLMTGKIETATGSDWVNFQFVAPGFPGTPYHPKVQLTNNAGGQYSMDVQTSCGTPVSCNDGGGGNNITVWEQNYTYPGSMPSDTTTKIVSVRVRVYRTLANTPTCDQYTVTATNP